jgi:hypothetical protein
MNLRTGQINLSKAVQEAFARIENLRREVDDVLNEFNERISCLERALGGIGVDISYYATPEPGEATAASPSALVAGTEMPEEADDGGREASEVSESTEEDEDGRGDDE